MRCRKSELAGALENEVARVGALHRHSARLGGRGDLLAGHQLGLDRLPFSGDQRGATRKAKLHSSAGLIVVAMIEARSATAPNRACQVSCVNGS